MDFIERANGSIIENKLSILFNLFLVLEGGRLSTLIEITDLPTNHAPVEYFNTITKLFPEFVYTVEHEINGMPWRFFASLTKLDPKEKYGNHDLWVATMLEFNCLGIPQPNNERYVLHYSIKSSESAHYVNFYSEICDTLENIKSKKLKFYRIARKLGWKMKEIIETIFPDNIWLLAVINKGSYNNNADWLKTHYNEFLEFVESMGLLYMDGIGIDKLFINYYNWIIFTLIRIEYDPFSIMYPLTNSESDTLTILDKTSFSGHSDPIEGFKTIVKSDFVKDKIKYLTPKQKTLFNKIKINLFKKYTDIVEFVRIKQLYNYDLK